MSEKITVGVIRRAHGIQGMVEVVPYTHDEHRFSQLKRVFINDKTGTQLIINKVRYTNKGILIKFKESNDRNFAESLVKKEIQIPEEERIELPEDTYFIDELIGCTVFNKNGDSIGSVIDIMESPANDIYVVKAEDGKEHLIPAISQFVKDINVTEKVIRIEEIPGLLS